MGLPPKAELIRTVKLALAEDIGSGDATTLSTVPPAAHIRANMVARETLVVAGLTLAELAFRQLSGKIKIKRVASDGQKLSRGDVLLKIEGPARAILTAERVALNF